MIKIVLDTNVIISGVLYRGNSFSILKKVENGQIELFSSIEILEELFEVLNREKFKKRKIQLKTDNEILFSKIISLINLISNVSSVELKMNETCRDSNDDIFIKCAIKSKSDFIVSGNKDLLEMDTIRGIKILTPQQFLDLL